MVLYILLQEAEELNDMVSEKLGEGGLDIDESVFIVSIMSKLSTCLSLVCILTCLVLAFFLHFQCYNGK